MRVKIKHRRLAALLARSRRSQNAWAHRLGLTPGHLSRLVNGKRRYPGVATREKLLKGLGVGFEELFEVEFKTTRVPAASAPSSSGSTMSRKGDNAMLQLASMLRIAARGLLRSPTFSAVVILTLSLGVGLTTAIFSIVDQVLLQPLPYPESERLVRIYHQHPPDGNLTSVSPLGLRDYTGTATAEMMAAYQQQDVNLSGGDQPVRVRAALTSPEFFPLLGARAAVGQLYSASETVAGAEGVVVISTPLWRSRFGADPAILSRTILLDNVAHQVIGVASPDFAYPAGVDLWKPLTIPDIMYTEGRRGWEYLSVLARLSPGVGPDQAAVAMADTLREASPRRYSRGQRVAAVPLREDLAGDTSRGLVALFAAAALLLVLACVNVANLFLVRAEHREAEFSLRIVLGSGRTALLKQLLAESTVIGLIGGALGCVSALACLRLLNALDLTPLAPFGTISVDGRALLFTLAVALAASLIFAVLPAAQAFRTDLATMLRGMGRFPGARRQLLRRGLVTVEVAFALVLLMGTLVFVRSFERLQSVDPGFSRDRILTFRIELPQSQYPPVEQVAFYGDLQERVGSIPGVETVGVASELPLKGRRWTASFGVVGREQAPDEPRAGGNMRIVSPEYFAALGIPLLEGRLFSHADIAARQPVAVVDETLARRVWPDRTAVGQQIDNSVLSGAQITVVGVVGSVKDVDLHSPSGGHVYFLLGQLPARGMNLVARTAFSDPLQIAPQVRASLHAIDPTLPFAEVMTLEQHVASSLNTARLSTLLLTLFGTVAVLLAAGGVYGLTAYSVTRRRSEIGVRMALGAQRTSLLGLVLREAMVLWLAGALAGSLLALALGQAVASLLFEVSPTQLSTLVVAALAMGSVTALAALVPARRAMNQDCVEALRSD